MARKWRRAAIFGCKSLTIKAIKGKIIVYVVECKEEILPQHVRGIPLWRIIVKKFVSLLIAVMLIVSLFAVCGVASAEESTTRDEVIFNQEYFESLEDISTLGFTHAVSDFSLNNDWLKDAEKVKKVFVGANYILSTAEDAADFAVTSESDKVFIEWCTPSKDYKDTWSCKSIGTITISSTGWYGFRYVLKDSSGSSSTGDSHVLARTSKIYMYFGDETAPAFKNLHSDMKTAMEDGITVGKTYTIKTNISITDTSSTTTSYVVYKKVKGAWTEQPIYDSKTKEVAEGFEDGISTSGVITMLESDVLPDNEPIYKIVYTVKDSLGYTTLVEDELTLFAKAVEKEPLTTAQIWQIVLFSVAGLSLVGIVVVLCIKPKDPEATQNNK